MIPKIPEPAENDFEGMMAWLRAVTTHRDIRMAQGVDPHHALQEVVPWPGRALTAQEITWFEAGVFSERGVGND